MQSAITSKIPSGHIQTVYEQVLQSVKTYHLPSSFIDEAWKYYRKKCPSNPAVNGGVFEYLIVETLIQEGITPVYFQSKFHHVPNCEFDIVLYHPRQPVVLSAKVSLRERYKQADLEGMALRQVYRQAKQHLITLSEREARTNQQKIGTGDIIGLDSIVVANKPEYDTLLQELKGMSFQHWQPVDPLSGKITF